MEKLLRLYKEEHGDVLVPMAYKTGDGYSLGSWVTTQRAHKRKGKLLAERLALLDEQGFIWSAECSPAPFKGYCSSG